MLQCTAVTEIPQGEALVALVDMRGGPDDPEDLLAANNFLLCVLGEHDEETEHAAHLWTAETRGSRDLWFLWAGTAAHRVYRFAVLRMCPASLRNFDEGTVRRCGFFDEHQPRAHSFQVADPLGELLAERARREAQQLIEDDPDDGDE
ncbi:hypothetical protein [Streptomyces sp. cmx-18-6]|uniref:hypothetical protein n=1 Tax=Streptomyces sp. cmx-18-6 TaxID=2790930 RepID=UPI0039808595